MRAIEYRSFGGPEVLRTIDAPKPVPGRGEALVRVSAIGLNFFEVLMRQNRYAFTPELPFAPGVEVAGVVEALGEGVNALAVGARVAVPMFAFGRGSAAAPNMCPSMPARWYRSPTGFLSRWQQR